MAGAAAHHLSQPTQVLLSGAAYLKRDQFDDSVREMADIMLDVLNRLRELIGRIQSPCLNCPNRFKDKRLCADSCVLLLRVQTLQAGCTAVDSADEARYQLMAAYDSTRAGVDSLSLY